MASITKRSGSYRAQIYVEGIRETATFRTQREAKAWADSRTTELRNYTKATPGEKHTLANAMQKYMDEVSPGKRGARWEKIRLTALLRDPSFPSDVPMGKLTTDLFAEWRDARSKQVQAGSVLREISLISALLETARIEWRWITNNPIKDIRKPRMPDHREVVINPKQVKAMLKVMGYSPKGKVTSVAQCVATCFLVALRTGMRAGELTGLTWDRVHADYCILPLTKTVPRNVPLTLKARRLILKMKGYDPTSVFGLKPQSLDANFRKYRERAGFSGFTFHDTRHTAATMLARKLDVLDLCRMFGWTTTKHALVYYNPTASSIADILNKGKS